MAKEIERKYLLRDERWREAVSGVTEIRQGYLANTDRCSIRVRISGDSADINLKSMTVDISRHEYEYPIPLDEARQLLAHFCRRPLIEKTRYLVPYAGQIFEIDVFHGENEGLIVAELELDRADSPVHKPDWLGEEVSDDPRYFNICLVEHPWREW